MAGTTEVRTGIFRRAIVTRRLARIACIAFLGSSAAIAQTPVANPSMPLYSDGSILTAVSAPDGSTIVGGSFAFIDEVPRANIARILADGSVDLTWNPGADGYVKSIAIDSSGSVYVSGCFSQIGGAPRDEKRAVWLRYARILVMGLTFQLAADIIETSISTSWEAIGRLGAIAVIRTFLEFFLERDVSEVRERQRETREHAG